jgi:hypothetical protein
MRPLIAIAALVLISGLISACLSPSDSRPGLHLSGNLVEEFPPDWSFTDAQREIAVEIHTPYFLPHSVTIWCATLDGSLIVGARDPETKNWPGWVDRDPDVRLQIGSEIYEARLSPIDDEGAVSRIVDSYSKKYDLPRSDGEPPNIRYWTVTPRLES